MSQCSFVSPPKISKKMFSTFIKNSQSNGILTIFPFNSMCIFKKNYTHLLSCLTNLLGSTNSKRIALNLKPFSTSVHMNLTYVITTATKICTNEFSIKFHNYTFSNSSRSSTHLINFNLILNDWI